MNEGAERHEYVGWREEGGETKTPDANDVEMEITLHLNLALQSTKWGGKQSSGLRKPGFNLN
jgi:hypothetical protein